MLLQWTVWIKSWLPTLYLAGAVAAPATLALSEAPPATNEPTATQPAPTIEAGVLDINSASIQLREGQSYIVRLPELETEADSLSAPRQSEWLLLEDNLPLGPAHCLHKDIASNGAGRFSHWRASLIFSSSDGTDPRTNGRQYTLIRRIDESGHRMFVPGGGEILILHPGDRIWWPYTGRLGFFIPRFGSRRSELNATMPRHDGPTLEFDDPGEYCVRAGTHSVRVLVLRRDREQWARQIVSFVAANTTGGPNDDPAWVGGPIDWPAVSRAHFHHLFSTEDSLDVTCGQSSRLVVVLADSVGLKARYCGWIGDNKEFAGHVGVEIYNDVRHAWEYYDPHFGLSARDRISALTLAQRLHDTYAGREAEAFIVLVDKQLGAEYLTPQWASFKAALQMWPDPTRRTSIALLLNNSIPATVDPEQFKETEFLSISKDIARFLAKLYGPVPSGAETGETTR